VTLLAIEEHWVLPELTAALQAMPQSVRDESLAFNEMGDNQQRLADLGAGRIAAMDAQGIDVSILALTPPTHPLPPKDAVRHESRPPGRRACPPTARSPRPIYSLVGASVLWGGNC
jgi:uncharacterized protein